MATKKKTTAIVSWEDKFAKYAKANTDKSKDIGDGGGTSIKFGPGTITVAGSTLPGGKLECVVLDWCFLNAWYKEKYDSANPQPPECYAFGEDAKTLAPTDDVEDKQSEACADCNWNVYGSAENGRGKACGNNVRLALITAKDAQEANDVSTAEVATARVSPTNLKAWKGYVEAVSEEHCRPPWAVVTEISSHPDPNTQIRLEFRLVDLIEDDTVLIALEKRYLKAQELLQKPYGPRIERPAKPAKRDVRSAKFAGKGGKR